LRRPIGHPAVMVAANGWPVETYQQFGGLARPQRTRHAIAEVDDLVDPSMLEIDKNRFERKNVAMNVA